MATVFKFCTTPEPMFQLVTLAHFGRCFKAGLLAVLISGLSACSTLQWTYQQGPLLAYWWLDSYVDFTAGQSTVAKQALQDWFNWHRRSELPRYEKFLQDVLTQSQAPATEDQVCGYWRQVQQHLLLGYEHAIPAMARTLATLNAGQINHLEERYAESDAEVEQEYVKAPRAKAFDKVHKRWREQLESFYGDLSDRQAQDLTQALQTSPFDAKVWMNERRLRHAEVVSSLRQLQTQGALPAAFESALRSWGQQALQSPRASYRAYRTQLEQVQCALVARMHNQASASQRAHAKDRITAYLQDVRALATSHP